MHQFVGAEEPCTLHVFTTGLLRALLSPTSLSSLPETFQLDVDRLRATRSDIHHLISLDICCEVFDDLVARGINTTAREAAKTSLRASLADIIGDSRRFGDHLGNIAVEIVRLVLQVEGLPNTSDSDLIDRAEQRLKAELPLSSRTFSLRAKSLLEEQSPALYDLVRSHVKLNPTVLHEAMVPTMSVGITFGNVKSSKPAENLKSLDNVLRRLTHIAVLHWHVWSPIVYNMAGEARNDQPAATPVTEADCDALSNCSASECDSDHGSIDSEGSFNSPSPSPGPDSNEVMMDCPEPSLESQTPE